MRFNCLFNSLRRDLRYHIIKKKNPNPNTSHRWYPNPDPNPNQPCRERNRSLCECQKFHPRRTKKPKRSYLITTHKIVERKNRWRNCQPISDKKMKGDKNQRPNDRVNSPRNRWWWWWWQVPEPVKFVRLLHMSLPIYYANMCQEKKKETIKTTTGPVCGQNIKTEERK